MSSSTTTADERVLDVAFSPEALSVSLRDGRVISVPLAWYPRLLNATPTERKNWKIAGAGYGIYWPEIDEDLSTDGLLRGAAAPNADVTKILGPGPLDIVGLLGLDSARPAQRSALDAAGIDALEQQTA